jgi:hypothetical protein
MGSAKLTFQPCGPKVRAQSRALFHARLYRFLLGSAPKKGSGFIDLDLNPPYPPPARQLLLFPSQVGKVEVIKQGAGNWENGHKTWLEGPAAYDYPDVIDGWAFKRPFLNPVFVVCAR